MAAHLDENLPLELIWRGEPVSRDIYWFGQEHVPKDLLEILSHVPLLSDAAVVLDGQNDGEAGRRKRAATTGAMPAGSSAENLAPVPSESSLHPHLPVLCLRLCCLQPSVQTASSKVCPPPAVGRGPESC